VAEGNSALDQRTLGVELQLMLLLCCAVLYTGVTRRYGSGLGSLGLMIVPLLCSIFCGNACVTSNSR
jgi:hypothetical protein